MMKNTASTESKFLSLTLFISMTLMFSGLLLIPSTGILAASNDCFYCNCPKKTHQTEEECLKVCGRKNLKCFGYNRGVCVPACTDYAGVKDAIVEDLAFLSAYSNRAFLDTAKSIGLTGEEYGDLAEACAGYLFGTGEGFIGNALDEDYVYEVCEKAFRTSPPDKNDSGVVGAAGTNPNDCSVNFDADYLRDETNYRYKRAKCHESVHQVRCLKMNRCLRDFVNPWGPALCTGPAPGDPSYGEWTHDDPTNYRTDELEAYCATLRCDLESLSEYDKCCESNEEELGALVGAALSFCSQ